MQRKEKKILCIITIIVIIFVLLFSVFRVQDIILKKIYPMKYSEYVYKYAEEYEVDPLLIFAIIKVESNFNPNVVSSSQAIGLMQLMDTTAEELATKLDLTFTQKSSLYNPELNIRLGTKYFSDLLKEYNNIPLALTAYNAGKGNVKRWIEQGTIKTDGSDIENVPYKETNNYVRKILRDYNIYQKLY
ncbi:MAG: lytic transglycosylase domain-containing protein [Clostridia bacterium]|nr:lytic transglycosylase domain-containing protein [Clostridia bacterium]